MITKSKLAKAIFLSLCVALAACGNTKKGNDKAGTDGTEQVDMSDFKEVKINNEYSMMLPGYLSKATNLNDEASLQYQNVFKETYIIVIDESKEEFVDAFKEVSVYDSTQSVLANYRQTQVNYFNEAVTNMQASTEPKAMEINGMKAEMLEFEAKVEEVPSNIYYILTFIEGKDKMYMIMAWTMPKNKEKYQEDFVAAIKSFKMLDGAPPAEAL